MTTSRSTPTTGADQNPPGRAGQPLARPPENTRPAENGASADAPPAADILPQVIAWQHYQLRALQCDHPLLILPLAGEKRVLGPNAPLSARPGEFLAVHQPAAFDMENLPPADGPYRAWFWVFSPAAVESARQFYRQQAPGGLPPPGERLASVGRADPLLTALQACQHAQNALPWQQDYASLGLLLALAQTGHGDFLRLPPDRLAPRIRRLVAADPARDWRSADFEQALHLSAATLRRKLAAENTALRELLREARLHHALALLQTTPLSLKRIAQAVGYRSLPAFRENFTARFGIAPDGVTAASQ